MGGGAGSSPSSDLVVAVDDIDGSVDVSDL